MKKTTVGLISDTHSYLDPELLRVFDGVDHIIHAGDIGKSEILQELEVVAPVTAVRGNIDGGNLRFLPLEEVVEIAGKRIAVLHIAGSPKRPRKAARDLLARQWPDIIVVGHSHIPVVGRVGRTLWINPGAAGREGFHSQRYAALLHILANGELKLDRISLGSRTQSAD